MKRIFACAVLIACVGCDERGTRGTSNLIPPKNTELASKFILDCCKATTPNYQGDRDPEDIVAECNRSAFDLYGESVQGWWKDNKFTPDYQMSDAMIAERNK
jgi:hypothetical protein